MSRVLRARVINSAVINNTQHPALMTRDLDSAQFLCFNRKDLPELISGWRGLIQFLLNLVDRVIC